MKLLALALTLALPPPFTSSVSRVTRAQLPHSWHAGCPVAPAQLRRVRLAYLGFDRRSHTGSVVVNADAVGAIVRVFARLYAARFPIRRLRPIDAYGEAIDVNPVENPYLEGSRVHPHAGAAYLNRSNVRPGMAVRGGLLVRAFAAVGWKWGGRWTPPDYQHFSATGG